MCKEVDSREVRAMLLKDSEVGGLDGTVGCGQCQWQCGEPGVAGDAAAGDADMVRMPDWQ